LLKRIDEFNPLQLPVPENSRALADVESKFHISGKPKITAVLTSDSVSVCFGTRDY
jgi:hypothetical protein